VKFETGEQALLGEVYLDVQRVLRGAHSTVLTLVLPTVNTRISVLGTRISSQPISYSGFTTVVSTIDAPGSEVTDTLLVTLNNEGRAGYSVTGTITRKIVVWTIDENGNQVFTRERLIRGLITSR